MAMLEEKNKRWKEEIKYFEKCLGLIKLKGDSLDPLEQEYVYKISIRIGYIYMEKLQQPYESVYWFEVAEYFRRNIAKNSKKESVFTKFYYDLYEDNAPAYIELELRRMKTNQLHVYMIEAYRQTNQVDKELQYRKILQEEEKE